MGRWSLPNRDKRTLYVQTLLQRCAVTGGGRMVNFEKTAKTG